MKTKLPEFLKPKQSSHLIRVGKDNDGGYLVDQRDIEQASHLVSFGVSDDWSFERDFYNRNAVPIHCYDGSVGFSFFLWKFFKTILTLQFHKWRKWWSLFDYLLFFRGDKKHYRYFISPILGAKNIAFKQSIERIKTSNDSKLFFSIDIEGAEYRILEDIIDVASKVSGLVIELHNVDLHLSQIEDFIKRLPLQLVHVHANNYGSVNHGIPLVLELTFSSHQPDADTLNLPHSLDQTNKVGRDEIVLEFA